MRLSSGRHDMKTFNNTDINDAKKQVRDIEFYGRDDKFKLICKASSKNERWMKSTKAMEIPDGDGASYGCVVQVTTQQGDNVAEAVCFVPGVRIIEEKDESGVVISRSIMREDR